MWKRFLKNLKLSESYISMALGLLVVVVIGILLFNAYSSREKPGLKTEETSTEERKSDIVSLPTSHVVAADENLWLIAERYFGSGYNWPDIVKENQLINPDSLEVGQILIIPKVTTILPITGINNKAEFPITGNSYTVMENDNLWEIAVRAYGDGYQWVKIAQANNLLDPDTIHTGNLLTLPR